MAQMDPKIKALIEQESMNPMNVFAAGPPKQTKSQDPWEIYQNERAIKMWKTIKWKEEKERREAEKATIEKQEAAEEAGSLRDDPNFAAAKDKAWKGPGEAAGKYKMTNDNAQAVVPFGQTHVVPVRTSETTVAQFEHDKGVKLRAIMINGAVHVETAEQAAERAERRRKKKSRWGGGGSRWDKGSATKDEKVIIKSMPTTVDARTMDDKTQEQYMLNLTIQECTQKLNSPDLGIPKNPRDRSPSPEPIYNTKGVRMNTREERTRNKLMNMRNVSITKLKDLDPSYQPPSHFKYKNTELEDTLPVPQVEYPSVNFVGMLLGPRGQHLDKLNKRFNVTIIIRGKGSQKSGMTGTKKDGTKFEAYDEDLHIWWKGQTVEEVKACGVELQRLIDMEIFDPDCEEAVQRRAKHFHDLAVMNGTLRDIDNKCLNCGRIGHKTWECDENKVFTSSVICQACGGVGHVTADCTAQRPGAAFVRTGVDKEVIDDEYDAFLSDLGVQMPKRKGKGKGGSGGDDAEKGYVPPMGESVNSVRGALQGNQKLMLTHGSSTPGAASTHARAVSANNPHGMMEIVGTSIFGGNMTRMTAGYKDKAQIEKEKEMKKQENQNRPVPLEWQVERQQKEYNQQYEAYLENLEAYVKSQKTAPTAMPSFGPPPGAAGPSGSGDASQPEDDVPLPELVGTAMKSLKD